MSLNLTDLPPIGALAPRAVILAYKENTDKLSASLTAEGFEVFVQRAHYNDQELTYSRTIRCLMNHREAWIRASKSDKCTVVVESDFVPCIGFGRLPAPFNPKHHGPLSWAFLYAGGPRVRLAHPDGLLEGHACCPVATLLTPGAAEILVRYADQELANKDLQQHSLWDTSYQWWAMGQQARCFLPYRNYGEHGGIANLEHAASRVGWTHRFPLLARCKFFNNHPAECLVAPLHFLPPYANGSKLSFAIQRFIARSIGFIRFFTGKTATPWSTQLFEYKLRAHYLAALRLLG